MLTRTIKTLLFLAVVAAFILLTLFAKKKRSEQPVKGLSIEIVDSMQNRFVLKSDVMNILRKRHAHIKSKQIGDVDRFSIERDIESHPSIEKSEVYTLVDGVVKIKIWQREPIYRFFGNKGFYIDSQGEIMPLSLNFTKRVPLVTGKVSRKFAKGKLFDFCKFIKNHDFWNKFIGQIHINNDNEVILIPIVGDFRILMGDISNFKKKLNKLKAFLGKAQENNIWGKYKFINLEYNNQIVCVK